MARYYVISPNVWNYKNESEIQRLTEEMLSKHIVLMGWTPQEKRGMVFAQLHVGDIVLVARRVDWKWKYHFIGSVSENYIESDDTHDGAQCRFLNNFIDLSHLNLTLLEEWSLNGSSQIPAIAELQPARSDDNFKIVKMIERLIREKTMNNEIVNLLLKSKNLILTGAPGTGKTYLAKNVAANLMFDKQFADLTDDERAQIGYVQFHPSYDYTDFVEGLRPVDDGGKGIGFERKDGVFKEFCKKAIVGSLDRYVFIIDEINRGEVSKIFGELFNAIESGYRGTDGCIKTQYQNLVKQTDVFYSGFFVPKKVLIIGTMNDIDRSVESIDFAFRRRFAWKEIKATDTQSMLNNLGRLTTEAKLRMDSLNDAIWNGKEGIEGLSSSYHIGAAYFLKLNEIEGDDEKRFSNLWDYHIKPLLREYLRGIDDVSIKLEKLENAYNLRNDS